MEDQRDPLATIDMLLGESRACRYDDPSRMVYLAELAQAAANRLPAEYGKDMIADTHARVWAELGNAYRLADHLDRGEAAFERALDCFEAGSRDEALLATIADRFAALLCHRRRFAQALALLDHLVSFHLSRGERHLAGRSLVTRGLYTGNAGDPAGAVFHTAKALELIEGHRDSSLVLAAVHNLFYCATELGYFAAVADALPLARPLYGNDRLNLLRLRGIEGRVAAGLGDLLSAEEHLHAARAGFAEANLVFPAALVSLDLALLWAGQSRYAEIVPLAEEMLAAFQALRIGREAIAALVLLRKACEEGRQSQVALVERIHTVKRALEDIERRPR